MQPVSFEAKTSCYNFKYSFKPQSTATEGSATLGPGTYKLNLGAHKFSCEPAVDVCPSHVEYNIMFSEDGATMSRVVDTLHWKHLRLQNKVLTSPTAARDKAVSSFDDEFDAAF